MFGGVTEAIKVSDSRFWFESNEFYELVMFFAGGDDHEVSPSGIEGCGRTLRQREPYGLEVR